MEANSIIKPGEDFESLSKHPRGRELPRRRDYDRENARHEKPLANVKCGITLLRDRATHKSHNNLKVNCPNHCVDRFKIPEDLGFQRAVCLSASVNNASDFGDTHYSQLIYAAETCQPKMNALWSRLQI